jgi:hypothetical protein
MLFSVFLFGLLQGIPYLLLAWAWPRDGKDRDSHSGVFNRLTGNENPQVFYSQRLANTGIAVVGQSGTYLSWKRLVGWHKLSWNRSRNSIFLSSSTIHRL